MIPNDDCFAELDPTVKDKFGIPVLRFHWKWSTHEIGQAAHMQKTFAEIIDAMGGRYFAQPQSGEKAIKQGGIIIHEVGGAMMGTDPKKSVTNSFGQSWDMKNLFITDGATLCSNADKNPDAHDHGARLARVGSHAGPDEEEGAVSMDRRTTIKWMFAAAAAPCRRCAALRSRPSRWRATSPRARRATAPIRISLKEWKAGGPWPLTLSVHARLTTAALCDLIIPADEVSPAASAVGVVDFIDEWISAPYPQQRGDREIVLRGPGVDRGGSAEALRQGVSRARRRAAERDRRRHLLGRRRRRRSSPTRAKFFAKFRDLTAGGFYTTPVGMKDIGYTRQRAAGEIRRPAAGGTEEGRAGLSGGRRSDADAPTTAAAQDSVRRVRAVMAPPR